MSTSGRQSNVLRSSKRCITIKSRYWKELLPCKHFCYCWNGFLSFGGHIGIEKRGSITSLVIIQKSWYVQFCWSAVATTIYLIVILAALKAQSIQTPLLIVFTPFILNSSIVNMNQSPEESLLFGYWSFRAFHFQTLYLWVRRCSIHFQLEVHNVLNSWPYNKKWLISNWWEKADKSKNERKKEQKNYDYKMKWVENSHQNLKIKKVLQLTVKRNAKILLTGSHRNGLQDHVEMQP